MRTTREIDQEQSKKTTNSGANTRYVTREPAAGPRRRRLSDLPSWLLAGSAVVILLLLWEGAVRAFQISAVILPAPSRVGESLIDGLASGQLIRHAWVTLQEVLAGYGLAVTLGLLVAVIVTTSVLAEKIIMPIVVVIQTIPKVAIAPLLIVWFGFGMESKILTTALIAFFPVLVNSVMGLNSASTEHIHMLRSFGASRFQVLTRLRFPNAVPSIVAGLDVAAILSIIGAVVSEFVGAQAGLGYLIMASNFTLDVSRMFAVLVMLSAIGLVMHGLIVFIGRKVAFWSEENRSRETRGASRAESIRARGQI